MEHIVTKLRKKLNLRKSEMADLLDISTPGLHNYEIGRRLPKPEIAYRIIDIAKLNGVILTLEDLYPRP
jgi:DNA-binding XRE family transcriptional regulator